MKKLLHSAIEIIVFVALQNTILAHSVAAEDAPVELAVQIGQRFEPLVTKFNETKKTFEENHPSKFYQGFVATTTTNNGVPLGVTFAMPGQIKLQHGKYSVNFPTGKFCSFDFSDTGQVKGFMLNPQLEYSSGAESKEIVREINKLFDRAGWKQESKQSPVRSTWDANWLKANVYVRRSTNCTKDVEAGEATEKCELVEVEIHERSRVTARIVQCGETEPQTTVEKQEAKGSHTGEISIMDPKADPVFKPGCPNIVAKLNTRFGIQVIVSGEDEAMIVPDLITRVTHPRLKDGATVDEWDSPMNVDLARYTGWIFENEDEIVPGKWTIEILLGTETLAKQEFNVRVTN